MSSSPMDQVIHQLRSMISREGLDASDGNLLESFVKNREEAALEALVRRHGSMVWGVCRRVLANHHDAEDAFQATFLVLVRKASSVKPRDMVGNWLYGVAHQTALKARSRSAKRQSREKQVIDMPEPAAPASDRDQDLSALLDQELSRLLEKYRAVLVLCELEGKSIKETAAQLGVPHGTIASRLARGRTILAKRLARYKLAVSAAALPALLAQQAAAATVPAAVLSTTIKTVCLVAAGKAASLLSVPVASLTQEMVRAMFLTKLGKYAVVFLVVVASCGLGLGAYAKFGAGTGEREVPNADKKDAEQAFKVRTPEEAARLREQFKANANEFRITIARREKADPKVDLRSIMLHASNRRFEPSAIGPSGQPIFKNARISKDQALKIIDALDTWAMFFRVATDGTRPPQHEEPYISTLIAYGPDAKPGPRLHLAQDWNWLMVGQLGAILHCVDGEAAKIVTELIQAFKDSQPVPAIQKQKPPEVDAAKRNILDLRFKQFKDDDLPQLPEDIEGLLLRGRLGYGANSVTDEGIKHLTRFTKLRILAVGGLALTDQALETIGKLTTLEELSLDSNKITGAGLRHLRGLKNLRKLDLSFNQLNPASLEYLTGLSGLISLRIYSTCPVDDRICELCSRLQNLRELHLSEITAAVTDRGLEHLAKLQHLENLFLRGSKITDAGLATIAGLTKLKKLQLHDLRTVTPEGMKVLGKLTNLRVLNIDTVPMDEAGVRALSGLTNLEEFLLWNVASRPHFSLDSLGELRSLRQFRTNMSVSSSAIRALARLQNLESIRDELFEVSDEDLTHLAKLPKLKTLILASDKVTAASLPTLAKMTSLRLLYVTEKVGITPEQWTALGRDSLPDCNISSYRAPYTVYHKGREN